MHDVTLITEWGTIPLDGREVGLRSWPDFFDGGSANLAWDQHSGAFREALPSGVQTGELELVVKPRKDVGPTVANILDSLRWGEDGFIIQVDSRSACSRQLNVRMVETGGITWHPEPQHAVMAEVPLRVEYGDAWLGDEGTRVVKNYNGIVTVPYAGDLPVWPTITIDGIARVSFSDEDERLALPRGKYMVFTDPATRGVFLPDGTPYVSGVVPFWPNPPKLKAGGFELFIDVQGANNSVTVDFQERFTKAWD